MKQKITPFLWFNDDAEAAIHHYVSVFDNSKINHLSRAPDGKVFTGSFQLNGQNFAALNGGPMYKFNAATSFFVKTQTAEEATKLWEKLSEGGMVRMPFNTYPWSEKYGWTVDRFGVDWQISLDATATQKITPALLFTQQSHGRGSEAIDFYTAVFKNSSVIAKAHYEAGESTYATTEMLKYSHFAIESQSFILMDSGVDMPFAFNEAISFVVNCTTQKEVDYYWDALISDGGSESQCGWLKDKFGVSWQIIPKVLGELMGDKDPIKSQNVVQAMMKMNKIIIKDLKKAHQKTS
jgi:predicted 3-demethylubiquinone-9 3-methyltransferase (glyoxalase superfamily)